MNLIKVLNWRNAVGQFSDEKVDEYRLQDLLNTIRLA